VKSGREVMKGEMEGKWKIAGTTVAMIAAVSVLALMIPMVSAGSGYSPYPGTGNDTITIIMGTKDVDISQWTSQFGVGPGQSILLVGYEGTDIEGESHRIDDVSDFDVPSTGWSKGLYGVNSSDSPWKVYVEKPTISVKIKLIDDTDVTGKVIVENQPFYVEVTTNFGSVLGKDEDKAIVKLDVKNPRGTTIVEDDYELSFKRDDVDTDVIIFPREAKEELSKPVDQRNRSKFYRLYDVKGVYHITAKTPSPGVEENNKLEISSDEVTLEISTERVSIDVEEAEVMKGETVVVTGTGASKTWYNLMISGNGGSFKKTKDVEPGKYVDKHGNHENVSEHAERYAAVKTDGSGKFRAEIDTTGVETGSYTIYIFKTDEIETEEDLEIGEEEDKVEYRVTEITVTLETDKTVYVRGEDVKISGEAPTADYVIIAIDEEVVKYEPVKADDTYEYTWTKTDKKIPGSYKIEVWNYPETWNKWGSSYEEITESPDATITIYLKEQSLSANVSRTEVALGDEFWIKGEAPGADNVNILVVSPKGTGGTVIDTGTKEELPSVYHKVVSVSTIDYTFEHKVSVDEDSDSGTYLVIVLAPGSGVPPKYDGIDATVSEFWDKLVDTYSLDTSSKTQDAFLDIVMDATVEAAGTNDFIWTGYVKCEEGYVKLAELESVAKGEPLVVNGTTNRKDGHPIVITVKGPVELPAQTAYAENGTFSVTFDTSDAVPGTYTVMADDGDGHVDEKTVEILAAVPSPTPSPSPTVSPTPTPTPSPTPTPTASPVAPTTPTPTPSPSPSPTPGFEAIFAVAGLLAVTYFVLRRKK